MNRAFIHGDLSPSLSGDERVALVRSIEEASELQKEVAKALRFGIENRYPADGPTNAEKIRAEFTDLEAALSDAGITGSTRAQILERVDDIRDELRKAWALVPLGVGGDDAMILAIDRMTQLVAETR